MVAVVHRDGNCLFANSAFENVLGLSRRNVQRGSLFDWFVESQLVRDTVSAVARNDFATSRFDGQLRRPLQVHGDPLPVHVIVNQMDRPDQVIVELVEIEQQTRQDREERALGQAQANKELIRNLAHEIKNPLGGIRGAAQLLEMEVESRALTEYTQVIINEADRLQALVDRLLAPHRKPHVVSDVNIHEVCERVRSLILAEFPRGLHGAPRLRHLDPRLPWRPRAADPGCSEHRAQRGAGAGRAHLAGGRRHHPAHAHRPPGHAAASSVIDWHWNCISSDNGPGVPESIRDRIFYPLVSGRGWRVGSGADAGADVRAATPGHDRMRELNRVRPFSRS